MRTILFYIPAELAGRPVFGVGWLLAVWLLVSAGILAYLIRRQGWNRDTASYLPLLAVIAGVIVILLPNLVEIGPSGQPLGVPIRGFGVMLMLATVSAVGLAAYRAWQLGFDPEIIYTLAFWMFIAGIAGARLFYIVEYAHEFIVKTPAGTIDVVKSLVQVANVSKGGLVVYGSVLAGLPAGIWYLRRSGLPLLVFADIIAPSMVVGQAIGRIGCFLNGCCYGGVCLTAGYALTFPTGSPPYSQQELSGWHSGIWLSQANPSDPVRVAYVAPGGAAEQAGLKAGQELASINGIRVIDLEGARTVLKESKTAFEIATAGGDIHRFTSGGGPPRSVPVHPTQLYAAIDAGLLALLLWTYFPFRRRDGEVFALLVTLHPISRFVLEMIRSDEPKQIFSALTISQGLSLAILAAACVLWWYIEQGTRLHEPKNLVPSPSAQP